MKYLIIGGTGSLGKKIIQRFSNDDELFVYSRDEAKQWTCKNELAKLHQTNVRFFVGDIRDINRLRSIVFQIKPDVIISASALKHVDTCELSPGESIATNLTGTQNVISVVNEFADIFSLPLTLLYVSTDKAVSPVNVYGCSKMLSERLVTSQSMLDNGVRYLCTRYGNVIESRGSIIPLFKYQSEHMPELTVTNPLMTRFLMTLDDSVDLIKVTLRKGSSGEIWIPIINAMQIGDLANIFSEISHKPIKVVGSRPGEKIHEDLVNSSENSRLVTVYEGFSPNDYHVISPSFMNNQKTRNIDYSSNDSVMTQNQLRDFLSKLNILNAPLESFKGLSIEEINTK